MDHIKELDELTRGTRRREFEDGLLDLIYGVVFFSVALLDWLLFSPSGLRWYATALIRNREVTIIAGLGLLAAIVLLAAGGKRWADRVRQRVIWADQGRVKALRWQVDRPVLLLGVGAVLLIILVSLVLLGKGAASQSLALRALVAAMGVGTGILYAGMGIRLGLTRYKWVGITGGVLSGLIVFIPLAFATAWLVVGVIWLVLLSISGSWALHRSLRALKG